MSELDRIHKRITLVETYGGAGLVRVEKLIERLAALESAIRETDEWSGEVELRFDKVNERIAALEKFNSGPPLAPALDLLEHSMENAEQRIAALERDSQELFHRTCGVDHGHAATQCRRIFNDNPAPPAASEQRCAWRYGSGNVCGEARKHSAHVHGDHWDPDWHDFTPAPSPPATADKRFVPEPHPFVRKVFDDGFCYECGWMESLSFHVDPAPRSAAPWRCPNCDRENCGLRRTGVCDPPAPKLDETTYLGQQLDMERAEVARLRPFEETVNRVEALIEEYEGAAWVLKVYRTLYPELERGAK